MEIRIDYYLTPCKCHPMFSFIFSKEKIKPSIAMNPRTIPTFSSHTIILLAIALFLSSCRTEPAATYSAEKRGEYPHAAVVSGHPLASQVGNDILEKGGNAVDAAVAVQFALAVVYPRAGNLGGGGFLVYRGNDGSTDALDYREKAPAAASRDMYLDSLANPVDGLSTKGHLAAGVPGTVAGLAAAHERYGKLPWEDLVQPAIELAENGFPVSATEADRLNGFQEAFLAFNTKECPFVKELWQTGDLLIQADLAASLKRIKAKKAAGFYQGETANLIVKEMQSGNGMITAEDLANYEPSWRQAITGNYDDYKIISMPPSSSGGVALLQMLGMVESAPLNEYGFHSTAATHLMVEAERRAYADRSEYLGDSDFYPVPLDSLIDENYLHYRMDDFQPDSASISDHLAAGNFVNMKESFETTHTSIVDAEGNAVSLTTTLNSNFGCKVVVDGAGFFLNNEMDDFSIKPGTPNQFGLLGAEANAIQPGKRMLSSMTPTIIEKDGQLFMVLGAPGGSTIITAVFQVFINVAEFGMPLDSAVFAPRFHHQWLPDQIWVEPTALGEEVKSELSAMGHQFRDVNRMAVIKAIQRLPDGSYLAVGDPRNPDDDVSGY
jgi:gamma-glutamyltranspeptidase/glutathione hydrolase